MCNHKLLCYFFSANQLYIKKGRMLYMVYSECHDDSTGCIINFIEGYEEAASWAQHYFDQYCDTIPLYADFHWPDMPVKLYYTLDREFKFHPDEPVFSVSMVLTLVLQLQ